MGLFKKKDRSLGVAKEKRRYDLPLNKGAGGTFLKLLMALMTILAIFALSASFALSEMTDRWSSGMENRVTIEIPAEGTNGKILSQNAIEATTNAIHSYLQTAPMVNASDIMPQHEIKALVSPWLGDDLAFDDIPLPGIISVEFRADSGVNYNNFENRIKRFGDHVRLDTHGTWLADLLKFTGALNFAALFLTLLIGLTTIITVAGAVQARMAIYKEELELLHLMGAGDRYIAAQLQRYSFITCFQGAAIGAAIGLGLLLIIAWFLKDQEINLLPDFEMSALQIMTLLLLPLFIALLALLTARQTVLRELGKMP